jgi:hypothetical protein
MGRFGAWAWLGFVATAIGAPAWQVRCVGLESAAGWLLELCLIQKSDSKERHGRMSD